MKSIEKQLNLTLGISLLLIFGIFWWLTVWSIHQLTENYMLERLGLDALEIKKHLYQTEEGQLTLPEPSLNPGYAQKHSGLYYVVRSGNQKLSSTSLSSYSLFLKPMLADVTQHHYETKGPVEDKILVYHQLFDFRGQPVDIYVAEDHAEVDQTLHFFDSIMVGFVVITLAILYWAQKILLRYAFRKLNPIYKALDDSSLGGDFRLNPNDYPEEVTPLVEKLNDAWLRIHTQLKKSRQANADMAHALKTPLNILYQLKEHEHVSSNPEVLKVLEEQTEKIYARLETELKAAQIAGEAKNLKRFSLESDLEDMVTSLKQLYPEKKIFLEIPSSLSEKVIPVEQQDGFELLGNLLDNAVKFSESCCQLKVLYEKNKCTLVIEDDGSGVPESKYQEILLRGYRLDESTPGHGLGLSIVQALVEAYGIKMSFKPSHLKGASHGLKVILEISQ